MDDVRAQLQELTTLVGDLVELARDEPMSRDPEPLDLADTVASALERVRPRAPGLTFDVEAESWTVIGEPPLLERAVTNLLDNAAKWSPEGGTVTVRLDDGVLTVSDEGPGHLRRRPAARLRPLLPLQRGAHAARIGPRAVDRAARGRTPRRHGDRGVARGRRKRLHDDRATSPRTRVLPDLTRSPSARSQP